MTVAVPYWQERGAGDAIVFLHGVGGHSQAWEYQLASFGTDHRAIAWDMPGYGQSARLPETTFPALADALLALLDHLGLERPHIVGHSIGGMVAQEFIARHPGRAASLVLSATSPAFGNPDGDFQKKFVAARLAPLDAGRSMADVADEVVPRLVGPGAGADGIALAKACMAQVAPETFRAMIHTLVTFDRRDTLSAIAVPTLCLSGSEDTNAPAPMMEKMALHIPGARYVCLNGLGHLANLESPAAFDAAVRDFLNSLSA